MVNLSNYMVSKRDLESDLVVARENAIKERKALLSSYIMMAKTAVDAVYSLPDSPENRQKVKELLRPLRYSSDGYFLSMTSKATPYCCRCVPSWRGKPLEPTRMPRASC